MDQLKSMRPVSYGPANDSSNISEASRADAAALARAHIRARDRAPSHRLDRRALGHSLRTVDLATILVLTVAGLLAVSNGDPLRLSAGEMIPMLAFAVLAPGLMAMVGLYRIAPREIAAFRVVRAFIATGLAGAAAIGLARLAAPDMAALSATFAVTAVGALALLQTIYAGFIRHWSKAGRLARNVVLVGATPNAAKLITANQGSGTVNVVGIFDDRKARAPMALAGTPYLGTTDDLFAWPLLPEVDRIILTVTPKAEARVRSLLARLRALPHTVCLLLDLEQFDPEGTSLEDIVGVRSARVSGYEQPVARLIAKRLQDLVLASLMLVAAAPVMALIALAVRLDSRGPVLFSQIRDGFNGRPIKVRKFRTMRHREQEADAPVRQVEFDDPRVTRLGHFLRKTSLDELPQLWNVLTGEMSLVGPRPHAPNMRTGGTETSRLVAEYAHRHRVKPGLTGWAQINGSRGPLHTPEAARERIRLDLEYISRSGFWFDLWIMLRTLPALMGDRVNIR
ncbi:exopolysaccharide biosynthesis polyprenyl glycosylphosphotransferase [Maricaulis sp. CAU 1757]